MRSEYCVMPFHSEQPRQAYWLVSVQTRSTLPCNACHRLPIPCLSFPVTGRIDAHHLLWAGCKEGAQYNGPDLAISGAVGMGTEMLLKPGQLGWVQGM